MILDAACPKISIIVPVYKLELYIDRCIQSIIAQTFDDWELILVDDGSPDLSGQICDGYSLADKRIRVIHKSNGGVSSARNIAIDNASGEWLCFIDGDDFVGPDYLSDFNLGNSSIDYFVQGYQVLEEKNGSIKYIKPRECGFQSDFDTIFFQGEKQSLSNSPCFKLYKRSIVTDNSIRFDTRLSYGEDHLFTLNYMMFVNSAYFSSGFSYTYFHRASDSLTTTVVPYTKLMLYAEEIYSAQIKLIRANKLSNINTELINNIYADNLFRAIKAYFTKDEVCYSDYRSIFLTRRQVLKHSAVNNVRRRLVNFLQVYCPYIAYMFFYVSLRIIK